jgi:hypothetical protein
VIRFLNTNDKEGQDKKDMSELATLDKSAASPASSVSYQMENKCITGKGQDCTDVAVLVSKLDKDGKVLAQTVIAFWMQPDASRYHLQGWPTKNKGTFIASGTALANNKCYDKAKVAQEKAKAKK